MAATIDLFLTDLDGVVRHFDTTVPDRLESEHDLEPGSLRREAFTHPRGQLAVTGGLRRAEWIDQVGEAVGSMDAARTWLGVAGTPWGVADPAMTTLIAEVRASGIPVALLTNGTDTIDAELASVHLTDAFDRVFCSWHLGVAKPDAAAFHAVCEGMGVEPGRVLFTDDSETNVAGATGAGLMAVHFTGADVLAATLRAHGTPI